MVKKNIITTPENGVITTNQFIWMLFMIITSVTALQLPSLLIRHAGRDAWISVFGGWLMDVLLAIIYAYMGIRFAGQNFAQYSITILGKYLGRVIGIVFPVFFLIVNVMLIRGLSQLMNNAFLPRTPLAVIIVTSYLVSAYGVRKGVEVLGRVTEILGPIYFLSAIIVGILISPEASFSRLEPQLANGYYPVLDGSIIILTFYGICVSMSVFIPLCNKPENGFLAKFSAVSLGAIFASIVVTMSIAVFGYTEAQNMYAPGFSLSRMISIGRFLERVEIIWMIITVGAGIMASAILLFCSSLMFSQISGLSTYKPLVNPTAFIAVILCLTAFNSDIEEIHFVEKIYPKIAIFVESGLEIMLFILALVFKKKAKAL